MLVWVSEVNSSPKLSSSTVLYILMLPTCTDTQILPLLLRKDQMREALTAV